MSSLPPPHPSLPRPPHSFSQHIPPPPPANPNTFSQPSYHNSHYAQAYNSYAPSTSNITPPVNTYLPQAQNYGSQRQNATMSSSWYQPGTHHCSLQTCSFTGSAKSVEIHMMDRHLIYPPGWEKRKKKPDWDADPSLKGKPIPIQGTNVVLDSPEVLEAWIAERKKRFPTSTNVEQKKRKLEEASARGQLDLSDIGLGHPKRRKVERPDNNQNNRRNERTNGRNFQSQNRVRDPPQSSNTEPNRSNSKSTSAFPQPKTSPPSPKSDDEDDDDAPEVISSKPQAMEAAVNQDSLVVNEVPSVASIPLAPLPAKQTPLVRPKNPPINPFASRPTLLRNLLAPEIRITVSNLSQAIRFLVDNDFLRNVELKPGDAADKNKIQVLTSSSDTVIP